MRYFQQEEYNGTRFKDWFLEKRTFDKKGTIIALTAAALSRFRSGKRVRGHFKLLELVEKRPGQWQQTLEFSVEIEGEDKPALTAEWISQFFV